MQTSSPKALPHCSARRAVLSRLEALFRGTRVPPRRRPLIDQPSLLLSLVLLAVFVTQGCTGGPGTVLPEDLPCGGEGLDLTKEFPPLYENGIAIRTPPLLIPAGTEVLYCYFGVYEGEEVGVISHFMQASTEGALHHAILKVGFDDDPPVGSLIDCTDGTVQDQGGPPLFEAVDDNSESSLITLPEGLAFKFPSGLRYTADVHYINSRPEPVCINVAWDLEVIPVEDVGAFASSYIMDRGSLSIPPGGETTVTFDCPWPQEIKLLSLGGHMHFHGSRYEIEHVREGGEPETIYEVNEWLPEYRFTSPVTHYGIEGHPVGAGDVFRTHCTYLNDGDTALGYPDEMCTTFGVAFPLDEPIYCDAAASSGLGESWGDGKGSLRGTIRRGPSITHDGVGDLMVAIFLQANNGPEGPGEPLATWFLRDADLSDPDGEIEYVLEGAPVAAGPLYVWVGLDDDGSGLDDGPTPGDLTAESSGILIPETDQVSFDFLLELFQ